MPASTLVMLGVKVTPEIKRRIREGADSSGKTISDYVRPLLEQPLSEPFDLVAAIEALDANPSVGLVLLAQVFARSRQGQEGLSAWMQRTGLTTAESFRQFVTTYFPEG